MCIIRRRGDCGRVGDSGGGGGGGREMEWVEWDANAREKRVAKWRDGGRCSLVCIIMCISA